MEVVGDDRLKPCYHGLQGALTATLAEVRSEREYDKNLHEVTNG